MAISYTIEFTKQGDFSYSKMQDRKSHQAEIHSG